MPPTTPTGEFRLLIDGDLVDAAEGGRFDNVNPATEEVLGQTADATSVDMDRAITAARRAFDETDWSTDRAFRQRCLRQHGPEIRLHPRRARDSTAITTGATDRPSRRRRHRPQHLACHPLAFIRSHHVAQRY